VSFADDVNDTEPVGAWLARDAFCDQKWNFTSKLVLL
jgi:hypothetical protein